MRQPDDLESDDELEAEFVFDLESDEPLEVTSLEPGVPESFNEPVPFVREDPELEWVERWRDSQKKRKRG